MPARPLMFLFMIFSFPALLAGCGIKPAQLDPPPGGDLHFPRQYPPAEEAPPVSPVPAPETRR